jgi:hypothetical protein
VLSAWGGVALLQARRQHDRVGKQGRVPTIASTPTLRATAWPVALVLLPLLRGPARRCGAMLIFAAMTLLLPLLGLVLTQQAWPASRGWWLAGWAALGWVLATRLGTLVREELLPLWQHTSTLPLPLSAVQRASPVLTSLPLLPSAVLIAVLAPQGRPWLLTALLLSAAAAAALEGRASTPKPEDRAALWMFTLALLVMLASQVWP